MAWHVRDNPRGGYELVSDEQELQNLRDLVAILIGTTAASVAERMADSFVVDFDSVYLKTVDSTIATMPPLLQASAQHAWDNRKAGLV